MFRVDVDGAAAGYAGWWEEEHDGAPVYEIGCVVEPAMAGTRRRLGGARRGGAAGALATGDRRPDRRLRERRATPPRTRCARGSDSRSSAPARSPSDDGADVDAGERLDDRQPTGACRCSVDARAAWECATTFRVLERANTPEMTRYLGGPETAEQLRRAAGALPAAQRDAARRACSGSTSTARRSAASATGRSSTRACPRGRRAGASSRQWQGRGHRARGAAAASSAGSPPTARATCSSPTRASTTPRRTRCAAAPASSTAARRPMPWRGGELTFNIWVLDMSPLDLDGPRADVDERFDGGGARRGRAGGRTTRRTGRRATRAAARWRLGAGRARAAHRRRHPAVGARARRRHPGLAPADRPVLRARRQRHRPAPLPRRASSCARSSPSTRLWLVAPRRDRGAAGRRSGIPTRWSPSGRSASRSSPDDCGEICIAEIFGSELDDDGGWVGVGVKPQNDPRLREDFEKIRVDGDLTGFHDYAVEWTPERVRFFIDGRWVKTVRPDDRLPGAAHARRVRVPPRRRHARHRRTPPRAPGRARAHVPAGETAPARARRVRRFRRVGTEPRRRNGCRSQLGRTAAGARRSEEADDPAVLVDVDRCRRPARPAGPGIVMMSPQIITTNPAPAARRTSRMSTTCPVGAPRSFGSVENEYWVFATHTG